MRDAFAGSVGPSRLAPQRLSAALAPADASSRGDARFAVAWVDGFAGSVETASAVGVGRVEHEDALTGELEAPPGTRTGDLLALAYRRFGAAMLERVHGLCAFVAWDDAGNGLLATDRLGSLSLFVRLRGDSLLFATELTPLLRLLETQPGPDEVSVVHWLADGTTPLGRTLYDGVARLAGGESIVFRHDGFETSRYWRPRYRGVLTGTREELSHQVRDAIGRAIAVRAPEKGTPAIFLSGGLDSGSVAAMLGEAGSLAAYSATFPEHADVDESTLVGELSRTLRFPVRFVEVLPVSTLLAALSYLDAWRVPPVTPNLHFLRRLAEAAHEGGARVVFDGEGGDQLFELEPLYLADLVSRARPDRALALARRFPGTGSSSRRLLLEFGVKGALPPSFRRLVRRLRGRGPRVPPWLNAHATHVLESSSDEWEWRTTLDGPLWWRARVDQVISQPLRFGATDAVRRNVGPELAPAHPLLDDLELIETVLSMPPELSFDPELDRPLLRAAVAGVLPDSIRLRRDKSYFDAIFSDSFDRHDRDAADRLVGAADARVNAYVRPEVVRRRVFDAEPAARGGRWTWLTWRVLGMELWLRSLEDASFVERFQAG